MTDDKPRPDDETQPVRSEGTATSPASEPARDPSTPVASTAAPMPAGSAVGTTGRRGLRERLRSLRTANGSRTFGLAALIASTLAGVIIGGLGFAAVHAIGDDGRRDRDGWMQQRDAGDRGPGRDGMRGGPRGVPDQLPPTTSPEDDDSSSS